MFPKLSGIGISGMECGNSSKFGAEMELSKSKKFTERILIYRILPEWRTKKAFISFNK